MFLFCPEGKECADFISQVHSVILVILKLSQSENLHFIQWWKCEPGYCVTWRCSTAPMFHGSQTHHLGVSNTCWKFLAASSSWDRSLMLLFNKTGRPHLLCVTNSNTPDLGGSSRMGRAVSAFRGFLTWWHGCIPQYVINSHVHPSDEHLPVISPFDWWIWDWLDLVFQASGWTSWRFLLCIRTALGFLAKEKPGLCINHWLLNILLSHLKSLTLNFYTQFLDSWRAIKQDLDRLQLFCRSDQFVLKVIKQSPKLHWQERFSLLLPGLTAHLGKALLLCSIQIELVPQQLLWKERGAPLRSARSQPPCQ